MIFLTHRKFSSDSPQYVGKKCVMRRRFECKDFILFARNEKTLDLSWKVGSETLGVEEEASVRQSRKWKSQGKSKLLRIRKQLDQVFQIGVYNLT